jgi:MFS family permease
LNTDSGSRNPWWIPRVLGTVPDVGDRLVTLLGLVSLAVFFEQYDNSMLTAALKHLAFELEIGEDNLGRFLGAIRLGALPALFFVPFADRFGRRRVFLVALIGFSVGTMASGLARDAYQFLALQMATRVFMTVGVAVAVVIITEEFPALHRGWAVGMMGALSAAGQGLGAGLAAFIEVLPGGWRFLYGIGIAPLVLLPGLRRNLKETGRFEKHVAAGHHRHDNWYSPLKSLLSEYPRRTAILGLVGFLFSIGELPVFQFSSYFVQTRHGWTTGEYSIMFLVGGGVGILGNVIAGRLGDRVGRRWVGAVFFALFPLFAAIFYHGPGWVLPIAWALFIFCSTAGGVTIRALSTELFPTSYRSTAAAWLAFTITIGWAVGLSAVGFEPGGEVDLSSRISVIACAVLLAGVFVTLRPETAGRELEEISHEE